MTKRSQRSNKPTPGTPVNPPVATEQTRFSTLQQNFTTAGVVAVISKYCRLGPLCVWQLYLGSSAILVQLMVLFGQQAA